MPEEEKKIRDVVEKTVENFDSLFIVDIIFRGNDVSQKILIFIDGDHGVSIDQCAKISRQVGGVMEENDFMSGRYTLEVSSAGLDFPITLYRQYVKNVGRSLEIETNSGEKIEGELLEVNKDVIILKGKETNQSFNFEEIKQSKVKVSLK